MARASKLLTKGGKPIQDLELMKVLKSEINHEISSNFFKFQNSEKGTLEGSLVDWDSAGSEDVVLRTKCKSGEEVAVSALLGPAKSTSYVNEFPRNVLMKVCIRKPGINSILQFDCRVFERSNNISEFHLYNAYYLNSTTCLVDSAYRGPLFRTLDPRLRDTFKEYLVSKGIDEQLTKFLLHHLHRKEQTQYVNWLQKLEAFVAKEDQLGTSA